MTDPEPPARTRNSGKHWAWFTGLLGGMGILGVTVAAALVLPLAMATAGCHDGSTDKVCQLSVTGENMLVWIPWMCVAVGGGAALAGAAFAERRKWTPLIGIPVGVLGYFATIPIGYWLAFAV
ncbi:hypothetical protein [Mycolicibacterium lutetiense]|uniref:Transmembrane protein n=1 Tax=Mycolicibacterium lutetiense TaxID=1641992 RepID=A0ABS4ZY63_9MYCO|nr:hypothetical protein [Mycolicibacterium lutetiense]MBP2454088.1 hypothetical protein [Mycolicibacterium lutetiense]